MGSRRNLLDSLGHNRNLPRLVMAVVGRWKLFELLGAICSTSMEWGIPLGISLVAYYRRPMGQGYVYIVFRS